MRSYVLTILVSLVMGLWLGLFIGALCACPKDRDWRTRD
jgi:hypothetical protein